jgi:hypothetical protein
MLFNLCINILLGIFKEQINDLDMLNEGDKIIVTKGEFTGQTGIIILERAMRFDRNYSKYIIKLENSQEMEANDLDGMIREY